MEKEINFKDIKNIIQKSIDINNAYIVKHNELLLIYNAYKKLLKKKNISKKEIEEKINIILKEYRTISQQQLLHMIAQQKDWMNEFNIIDHNVDLIIKKYVTEQNKILNNVNNC